MTPSIDLPRLCRPFAVLAALAVVAAPIRAQGACFWEGVSAAPAAQFEAPTLSIDGRLVVFGGFQPGLLASSRVNVYDPVTDTWTSRSDLPEPLTHAGLARDGREVWLAGGFLGDHPGPVVDRVWVYDIDLDSWNAGPPLPAPRGSGGLFRIQRELHFVGGVASDRNTDCGEHWVLDLDHPNAWSPAAPVPSPRNHFAAITLADRGYVIGGQNRHDNAPDDVDLVHAWAPATGWTQCASLPYPRSHFESATFPLDGRIVIAGGRANTVGLPAVRDVTLYDPQADQWWPLTELPAALLGPGVKVVANTLVLTGGGAHPHQLYATTFRRPLQAAAFGHLRVNAGAGALTLTEPWCGDLGSIGGKAWFNQNVGDIAGTLDDELYRSERSGSNADPQHFAYSIAAPPGEYALRLHFAEIFFGAPGGVAGAPGKRVFDVTVEGQLVLDDLDLYAVHGPVTAGVHAFHVVLADGALDMSFDASANRPTLAAYEIVPLIRDGAYCTGSPNSVGPGARMAWSGTMALYANEFLLATTGLPPNAKGIYLQSSTQSLAPFASGILCVGPKLYRVGGAEQADPSGVLLVGLDLSQAQPPAATITPGSTWNFQLWYRDTGHATSNLSDALAITFKP